MEHLKQFCIPDRFSSQIDNRLQGVIKNAISDFNNKMDGCIKIRPKTSQDKDWVDIIKDGGCWSYIGRTQTGRQEISLSKFCTFPCLTIFIFLPVAEFCRLQVAGFQHLLCQFSNNLLENDLKHIFVGLRASGQKV